MEPKHHSKSKRHITVSAEIKIDLQHIGKCAKSGARRSDLRSRCSKEIVCYQSHGIGDQNFFT